MTENEAKEVVKKLRNKAELFKNSGFAVDGIVKSFEDSANAIEMLSEEIQQCREYKEIFENHFSEEALKLLSDKEEFGKWLERGRWIAKKCDEINRELEQYRAIGTIEEVKVLKEKSEPKKPIIHGLGQRYCPICKCGGADHFYCARCGQKLG